MTFLQFIKQEIKEIKEDNEAIRSIKYIALNVIVDIALFAIVLCLSSWICKTTENWVAALLIIVLFLVWLVAAVILGVFTSFYLEEVEFEDAAEKRNNGKR